MEFVLSSVEELAEIFKALSDPTRLKIFQLLLDKKRQCVNAITKHLDVSQSAVSQHLRVLKQAGFVNNERNGYHIHYSINEDVFNKFKELTHDIFAHE